MKKLNDEQLSRVLSALAGGALGDPTDLTYSSGTVCLVQACDVEPHCDLLYYSRVQVDWATWFDGWRKGRRDVSRIKLVSPDKFLADLEKAGLA